MSICVIKEAHVDQVDHNNMNEKASIQGLKIRLFEQDDFEACRHLWEELTEWHRDFYADSTIGGDNPGLYFDKHLDQVGAHNLLVADLNGRVIGLTGLIVEDTGAEV